MSRLRRSDPARPGLGRVRRGRGFGYVDADGAPAAEVDVQRARDLAIPPAWTNVWISPWTNGHIQATGLDDAGRRQYLYHEQWRARQDRLKHEHVLDLAARLPALRRRIASDLDTRGLNRDRVLGAAVRMLDLGLFRPSAASSTPRGTGPSAWRPCTGTTYGCAAAWRCSTTWPKAAPRVGRKSTTISSLR